MYSFLGSFCIQFLNGHILWIFANLSVAVNGEHLYICLEIKAKMCYKILLMKKAALHASARRVQPSASDVLLKAEGADKSTYVKLMKLIKSFFSREIVCVSVCVCACNPPVCTPVLSQAQILAVFKNNTGNG